MANNIRLEFSANVEDLKLADQYLSELRKGQIELARAAQSGEKTIREALDAQISKGRDVLALERLINNAKKATAEEQKRLNQEAIAQQNILNGKIESQKGILQELRAELKQLRKAREESFDVSEINRYTSAIENTQKEINKLTGANDKFKGSNGFWQETRQLIVAAFAVDTIKDWTVKMFSASSQIESFKNSLNRLVGEKEGVKIFDELSKAIVNTPLEFEGATKQIEKLIFAYQDAGKSTKNIVQDFLAVGNVAKGNQENVQGITKALADTAAAGKATAQEFNQFSNAGVNLFQLLSESTGKSRKELLQWRADGLISFDLVQQAILKAGSEGGRFFGAMDTQSQTTAGRFSSFKDAVFFALGNIGKQFDSTAKSILNFGSSTLTSLFGAESSVKSIVESVKLAVSTWAIYKTAIVAVDVAKKALLVTKGLSILAIEAETGVIAANTMALGASRNAAISARTAAIAFSGAISTLGPIALATSAIALLVKAYQEVSEKQENAKKINYDWVKANDESIKSITEGSVKMAIAFDKVTALKEGTDLHKQAIDNLIQTYPNLFKSLDASTTKHSELVKIYDDLGKSKDKEAEKIREQILNLLKLGEGTDAYKKGLSSLISKYPEYFTKLNTEKDKNEALRKIYAEVNKEIENKISLMAREKIAQESTNRLVEIRQKLIEKGISSTSVSDYTKNAPVFDFTNNRNLLIEYNKLLKSSDSNEKALGNQRIKNFNSEYSELRNLHDKKLIDDKNFFAKREALMVEYHIKQKAAEVANVNEINTNTGKGAKEKAEILKNYALEEEILRLSALKKTLATDELILRTKLKNDIEKLKGHKNYTQEVKLLELQLQVDLKKLNEEYGLDLSKLLPLQIEKIKNNNKEKLGLEITHAKDIEKLDKDIEKNKGKNRIESLKVEDGLRLLERISGAKSSKEIIKIKEEEIKKILNEEYLYHKEKKDKATLNFEFIKSIFKEDTKQFKKGLNDKLEAEQGYYDASDKLVQARLDEAERRRRKKIEAAFAGISEIVSQTFGLIEKNLQKSLDSTNDLVKQAQIKNQQQGLELAKQGLSAITSFASGNLAQGVVQTIGLIFNGVDLLINGSKRKAEAEFKTMSNLLGVFAESSDLTLNAFKDNYERIIELYSKLETTNGKLLIDIKLDSKIEFTLDLLKAYASNIVEFGKVIDGSNMKIEELLNYELKRADAITENYKKEIDLENKRFEKQIDNLKKGNDETLAKIKEVHEAKLKSINESFDLEISKVNEIYAKRSQLATLNFNKETFEINQAGINQLEALITNETSLNSVREEFAQKRLDILNAFPLANKAATDGMTAAEIESINASVKARDEAIASLQKNYFDELVNIANAEGQKRKEYTATEKIQNEIRDRLYLASLKFDADEIIRIKEKNDAIAVLEKQKNEAILSEKSSFDLSVLIQNEIFNQQVIDFEKAHKENLLAIDNDYNLKIQESYKVTTALLQSLSNDITNALTNTALKGTEEYKKLEAQLFRVNEMLERIKNGNNQPFNPINIPTINIGDGIRIGGFADGTDRLPRKSGKAGVDTELIRADAGERIMPTRENNLLKRHFGKDLKNAEIVKMLTTESKSKMPVFINPIMTSDVKELVQREMNLKFSFQIDSVAKSIESSNKKVVDKLDSLPLNIFNWDGKGFSKSTKTRNTFVTQKRNRYYGSI